MATIFWRGGTSAVAQVSDATVDTFDAATTYTVTIGGYPVAVVGNTDTATTAADLVAALNLSDHPYFAAVTWSVPSGSTVRGVADRLGDPFLAALTVSGGTGTVTDFADTTACTGPHHADQPDNYSGGALPGAADVLVLADGPSILYGLTAVTAALASAVVRMSYSGLVGLEPSQFSISVDGATTDPAVREYRQAYLELSADEIVVGRDIGAGAPVGSPRLSLDQQKAGASTLYVENTGAATLNDRPALRYLAAHASADVVVLSAPGGVGIALEPGEVATLGDFLVADRTAVSALRIGQGVTYTSLESFGGDVRAAAAATVTSVRAHGGTMALVGLDYLITLLQVHGGVVTDSHENTGGAEWTTIDVFGGTLVLPGATSGTRDYTTLNLYRGRVEGDWERLSGTEVLAVSATIPAYRAMDVTS